MGSLYDIASDAVVRPREIGHTHLEGRLYEKPLKATALLLGFLVYVLLVTLIQGEFLVRVARRLQGDLQTNIRVGGLRENTHSLTMSPHQPRRRVRDHSRHSPKHGSRPPG